MSLRPHVQLSNIIPPSIIFLLLPTAARGQTAPERFVGYTGDPNGRGTASLILSCLLTLVLCVWSALHLNVPARGYGVCRSLWLNVRWIAAGIYAPELVVFVAWRQWCSARLLQSRAEATAEAASSLGVDSTERPLKRRRTPWTMAHSFFACAGGFTVELEALRGAIPASDEGEKGSLPRLTLTARGMMMLVQYAELPIVDRGEIEDKSKANDLAKATVIVQAIWMLVQVIGRLIARLPVTLLEVNTVAHVLCAFAMYLFWWNKPLLPTEPIVIRDESLAPLVALMYCSSEMSGYLRPEHVESQTLVKTLFANLSLYSKTPEVEALCFRHASLRRDEATDKDGRASATTVEQCSGQGQHAKTTEEAHMGEMHRPSHSPLFNDSPAGLRRAPDACVSWLEGIREKDEDTAFFERRPRVIHRRPSSELPSPAELKRWDLIEQAFHNYPGLFSDRIFATHNVALSSLPSWPLSSPQSASCIHLRPEQLVASHIKNWPSNDLLRNVNGLVVGMILWLANLCYGGFHAAAWNDHFPSAAEMWLWRVSASYIAFCGGLWVTLNFMVARWAALNSFWEKWMDGQKSLAQTLGLGVVVVVCGFSLFLARTFLVLEAFISIRQLPAAAYDTPQWTDIFPHF